MVVLSHSPHTTSSCTGLCRSHCSKHEQTCTNLVSGVCNLVCALERERAWLSETRIKNKQIFAKKSVMWNIDAQSAKREVERERERTNEIKIDCLQVALHRTSLSLPWLHFNCLSAARFCQPFSQSVSQLVERSGGWAVAWLIVL